MQNKTNCDVVGCPNKVLLHFSEIESRQLIRYRALCKEDADNALGEFNQSTRGDCTAKSIPQCAGATCHDLEYLMHNEETDGAWFSSRRVGGWGQVTVGTGVVELWAIHYAIESPPVPRPLTHQAMLSTIKKLGGDLNHVIIDKLIEAEMVYHAKLSIRQYERDVLVDIRPSDAVILAIEADIPIFVADEVLHQIHELWSVP